MSDNHVNVATLRRASHWRFIALAGASLLALMLLARHTGGRKPVHQLREEGSNVD